MLKELEYNECLDVIKFRKGDVLEDRCVKFLYNLFIEIFENKPRVIVSNGK